ncbi:MAG: voltage-gated potassium channel [Archaeoglobi archaeon]|nr:voltage-gated potassium channel [Archaeoglobi archaeon]
MEIRKRILQVLILLFSVILGGTLGYHFLEGWPLFDSLYMTVITITTTGYGEIREMGLSGRILSMLLMFFGVGIFLYSINILMMLLLESTPRRWEKMIEKMRDHVILCGYGDMGREIARELPKDMTVVIDLDVNKVEIAREDGFLSVHGDATEEGVLERAGVRRAKALVCCMTDSANAFATLTAKELNPSLKSIAVLRTPRSERKMIRAGIDVLLSPYRDTARKIAGILREEPVVEFLETVMIGEKPLYLEKYVAEDESMVGKTLRELDLRRKTGCTVLAIVREGNILLPDADTRIERGDIMYMLCREPVRFGGNLR